MFLYTQCAIGTVVLKSYDADGYGNYLIMKDDETGMGFLYGHLRDATPLNVGDKVQIGTFVRHRRNNWKFYRYTLAR